jgi:hypothetical protein
MTYLLPLFLVVFMIPKHVRAQGVSAPWDISQAATALASQTERLKPVLEQLTPEQWQSKGAPATYVTQWRAAQNEVGYVVNAANAMGKQPEKLPLALETYFRLQAVEAEINSLVEGVRRYQNPAVGDLLLSVMAANSTNRDQLRQYITDLAESKDQEFQVVDKEAQRCRDSLVRQGPARTPAAPKPAASKPGDQKPAEPKPAVKAPGTESKP